MPVRCTPRQRRHSRAASGSAGRGTAWRFRVGSPPRTRCSSAALSASRRVSVSSVTNATWNASAPSRTGAPARRASLPDFLGGRSGLDGLKTNSAPTPKPLPILSTPPRARAPPQQQPPARQTFLLILFWSHSVILHARKNHCASVRRRCTKRKLVWRPLCDHPPRQLALAAALVAHFDQLDAEAETPRRMPRSRSSSSASAAGRVESSFPRAARRPRSSRGAQCQVARRCRRLDANQAAAPCRR
jgi:hypothetical protein